MLIAVVILLFLLPATVACLHYAVGGVLGRFSRSIPFRAPTHRLAILIPAHNEESTLPRALASIAAADYPAELLTVHIVADHCTDETEIVAREFGASCSVRSGSLERGKGYALAHGFAAVLPTRPDAVLILDADCRIAPGLLRRLDAELADGAEVVQAGVISECDPTHPASIVAAVGSVIDNRLAAAGDRFGRSVPLRGTGMLFTRGILGVFPWASFGLCEDAEYGARLREHGVRIRFAPEIVTCEAPAGESDFLGQRRRWRASLRVPQADRWFASKPLILLHLMLTMIAVSLAADPALSLWLGVLLAITAATYGDAMLRVGIRWPGFRSFWLVGRLALVAFGGSREMPWVSTPRRSD